MDHFLVLDSNKEDIFLCGSCKQVFNSLPIFVAHKNSECKKDSLPAASSKNVTVFEVPLTCSVNQKTEVGNNQELNCTKKKPIKTNTLQSHLKLNDKPYQCVICGRCFVQNSHLQRHVLTHKVWPDGISKTTAKTAEVGLLSYSCLYCNLTVPTYNQFRVHLKTHLCLKKFKCVQNQCNSFYDTIDTLMHHVSSTHKAENFWCHNCSTIFHSLEDIAFHYQSCNNMCVVSLPKTKLFKCNQCDAVFRKAEKLSLHMLTETHKKSCIHCGKIFSSDKRLRLHLQIHRKLKPFECNICGQRFHMKKYLSSHLLKHGEKKYACKICKTLFKRQDSLQRHMKSHKIRKMYKCPFTDLLNCKKEFTRNDKLKSHIKFHTKTMAAPNNKNPQNVTGTVKIGITNKKSESKK